MSDEAAADPRREPEVTVVIPTKDRWSLLATSALPSALGQEGVEVEVVVVDDGSTDATSKRLRALGDARVRAVRHDTPRGVAQARNAGVAAARGEWVSFLDDDDLWSPRKLRAQLDAAGSVDATFVYGGVAWVDHGHRFLFALRPPDPEGLASRILRWNVMWGGCSNVMARTDVVRRLGGFDEQLFQLADWDLWIRLALDGRAAVCPELVVGYVMQPQSMLLTDRRDVFAEFDYLVEKHRSVAEELGVHPDGASFSRWVAMGHLRAGRRRVAARTYLRGAVRYRDPGAAARAVGAAGGLRGLRAAQALLAPLGRGRDERVDAAEPDWLGRYRGEEASSSTSWTAK
jgi:hypothetical protein